MSLCRRIGFLSYATNGTTNFSLPLKGRERKKNEALAARIFGKNDRRQSAPLKATAGPLASRSGVKKVPTDPNSLLDL